MSKIHGSCAICGVLSKSTFCKIAPGQLGLLESKRKFVQLENGKESKFTHDGKVGFYCLKGGFLKLNYLEHDMKKAVRICGPGDLVGFGKAKAIRAGLMTVSAIGGPADLCFISDDDIHDVALKAPSVLLGLLEMTATLLEQSEERVCALSNRYLKNRVASVLRMLGERFGVPSEIGTRIGVNIDRKTISEMAGTVVESTARVLTELEDEKIIARMGRGIHILDRAKLERL